MQGAYLEGYVTPDRFTSYEGTRHLDLTGDANQGVQSISQTVVTQVGAQYTLSFAMANLGHFVSPGVQSGYYCTDASCTSIVNLYQNASQVELIVNGGAPVIFTNNLVGVWDGTYQNNIWQTYSATFVGTGSDTVTFRNLASNDNYVGLDAISLQEVPEPGTIAIMGFGLCALGLLRKRFRRS